MMISCPRCKAENKAGRSSCWNCWFPLPQPEASIAPEATPIDMAVATTKKHELSATDVNRTDILSPSLTDRQSTTLPVSATRSEVIRHKEFTYVAETVVQGEGDHSNRLLAIITTVTVLLLAAVLTWHFTLRQPSQPTTPTSVGQAYLNALVTGDSGQLQQLATEDSKSILLPGWFVIETAQLTGNSDISNGRALFSVTVRLIAAPGDPAAERSDLEAVFAQRYQVMLEVEKKQQVWRVNQKRFFDGLRSALEMKNATRSLPRWD